MSWYLRPMTREDVPQVTEIDREAFPTQWPPPNYNNELRNQSAYFFVACDSERPAPEAEIETKAEQKKTGFIARLKRIFRDNRSPGGGSSRSKGGYIVGFVGAWVMGDEAHITSIAVREAYRRRGIGEMLLIAAIEKAMELKASIVTLEVRVSNTGAQRLYKKYGFTQVGLRKAYYTDNREDAYIMSTDKLDSALFQSRFQQLKQACLNK